MHLGIDIENSALRSRCSNQPSQPLASMISTKAHLDSDVVELTQCLSFHSNLRGKLSGWADDQGRDLASWCVLHLNDMDNISSYLRAIVCAEHSGYQAAGKYPARPVEYSFGHNHKIHVCFCHAVGSARNTQTHMVMYHPKLLQSCSEGETG